MSQVYLKSWRVYNVNIFEEFHLVLQPSSKDNYSSLIELL